VQDVWLANQARVPWRVRSIGHQGFDWHDISLWLSQQFAPSSRNVPRTVYTRVTLARQRGFLRSENTLMHNLVSRCNQVITYFGWWRH
jgi:hypothetical protein